MFFDDAVTASRELELTLTGKDCGQEERAPMCGIPHHAAEIYISRLIAKGYKVAICEQLEDPKTAKGIVKRGVIRVVTPGTVVDSTESDTTKAGLGFTLAQNYYPGDVIPKDPTIKNVQEDAWVAIKVEYSEDTKGIIESITFDTAKWGLNPIATSGNSELYMYNSVLAKDAATSALFSEVKIKSTVTDTKDFNIKVSGYAVQAHGVDEATATQELKTLAGF